MKRIVNSVAYFYSSVDKAKAGLRGGGSGFVISKPSKNPSGVHFYLVTAWHVVEGGTGSCVVKINNPDGSSNAVIRDLQGQTWYRSSEADDLAICPIRDLGFSPDSIPLEFLVTRAMLDEHNLGPGDEVFMSGRFSERSGKERNRPILRFGNIAERPHSEMLPAIGVAQETILVEMRSVSGFSGSPVYVYRGPFASRPDLPNISAIERIFVLGVDTGHVTRRDPLRLKNDTEAPGGLFVRSNTAMAIVVPAWKIVDTLSLPELEEQRRAERELLRTEIEESSREIELDLGRPTKLDG